MNRALDRRIAALEAARPRAEDPWEVILHELPMAALNALEAMWTAHPTDEEAEARCLQILKDYAPDAATLERWLHSVEAP